jgi:small-conductance mechanosensitive channel
MRKLFIVFLTGMLLMGGARAQEIAPHVLNAAEMATTNTTMLLFHGQELFELSPISALSAKDRAKLLTHRLKRLADSPLVNTREISVVRDEDMHVSSIMYQGDLIVSVWEVDAKLHDVPREKLAEHWGGIIIEIIDRYRADRTTAALTKSSLKAILATLIFLLIWFVVSKLGRKELNLVEKKFAGRKMLKFLDGDSIVTINGYAVNFIRFIVMAWVFIIYLNLVLSCFPWTFNLSAQLYSMVRHPIIHFWHAFVENLPNLIGLLVIIAIMVLVLRSLKHIFNQIGNGRVRIRGFYQDWADPTYRLVRIFIIVFTAVVAFPLIPGSSSPAFKGISIFMGVLLSLGSSSAVGNIVAGLVLTYMRPFVNDDFVEISGQRGRVKSRGTFSTQLQTPTNEIISIPNASVSSNHIINYSQMAKRGGVNVGTNVTIGYDVPWRKVHELLIESAEGVPEVLTNPPPKVFQLSLDDFYVQYKLIITTKHPELRYPIRSNLHQNIQDNFAKAGIEILSPHYQSNRAGDASTIPVGGEEES